MNKTLTDMREILKGFANAMNLLNPEVPKNHQRVAYLSYNLAAEMGYKEEDRIQLIFASIFYDAGLSVLPERDDDGIMVTYRFDEITKASVSIIGNTPKLAFVNKILLGVAEDDIENFMDEQPGRVKVLNKILYLADAVSKLLDYKRAVLNQISDVSEDISEMAGDDIPVEVVEAFLRLTKKEYVWMDLMHQPEVFLDYIPANQEISLDEAIEYARIMSRIIDYRSSFTAMHSSGVVVTAVRLAELIGMSEVECKMIMIAGYLHDIGKLTIPKSVLEKNDKLTDEEFNIVKEHAYYTYLMLKNIRGFENIGKWASLHHEKLNGTGYPFGYSADDIPMGARIMAVADIFSAVAEIRPYRLGMPKDKVIEILMDGAGSGALSRYLVELLINNYQDIYEKRDVEVRAEGARYYAAIIDSEERDM